MHYKRSFKHPAYFLVVLSLLHVLIHVGDAALSAVVPVVVLGHEGTYACDGGVLAEALDFAGFFDAVIL